MQSSYYIETSGQKDGPHDLITIMRRIRSGKIHKSTYIFVGEALTPTPAIHIPEISLFFDRSDGPPMSRETVAKSTWDLIASGWLFTTEHNIMTVYAGAMLLLCLLLIFGIAPHLGLILSAMIVWCIFMLLQSFYVIFTLRLFRGQTFGAHFFESLLAPIVPSLILFSLLLALMMAGGFFLLFIPGLVVTVLYIFVPFLMFDKKYRPVEAMHASRLLLQKYGRSYIPAVTLLVLIYFFCVVLIIPIPLVFPTFAASLSQLYEELSAT